VNARGAAKAPSEKSLPESAGLEFFDSDTRTLLTKNTEKSPRASHN
jgi:hypothetical protein